MCRRQRGMFTAETGQWEGLRMSRKGESPRNEGLEIQCGGGGTKWISAEGCELDSTIKFFQNDEEHGRYTSRSSRLRKKARGEGYLKAGAGTSGDQQTLASKKDKRVSECHQISAFFEKHHLILMHHHSAVVCSSL